MATKLVAFVTESSEPRYRIHREPVWGDRANFVIRAKLPDTDDFEQLWCRQMTDSNYEVCCIPFYLYDVALGDVVVARTSDLTMCEVLQSSGRFVFRVWFEATGHSIHDPVAEMLKQEGALLEWWSPRLLAVDASDQSHAQRIADYLADQERRGRLAYETGRTK